jgi:hypothetical protein
MKLSRADGVVIRVFVAIMMVLSLVLITQCIIHKHNELRMQRYALAPYKFYEEMANDEEYAGEGVSKIFSEVAEEMSEASVAEEVSEASEVIEKQ